MVRAKVWKDLTLAWKSSDLTPVWKQLAQAWKQLALAWKALVDYWAYFRRLLCPRRRISGVQQESVQQNHLEWPCEEVVSSSDPLFPFIFWTGAPISKRKPAVRTMKREPGCVNQRPRIRSIQFC